VGNRYNDNPAYFHPKYDAKREPSHKALPMTSIDSRELFRVVSDSP
jgi:hypothetical protein